VSAGKDVSAESDHAVSPERKFFAVLDSAGFRVMETESPIG
jgi:hypothetical protein